VFGDFPGFVEVFADDVAEGDQESQGEGVGLMLDEVAEDCYLTHEEVIADVSDGVGDDEPPPAFSTPTTPSQRTDCPLGGYTLPASLAGPRAAVRSGDEEDSGD
jgi:hypothetical protein